MDEYDLEAPREDEGPLSHGIYVENPLQMSPRTARSFMSPHTYSSPDPTFLLDQPLSQHHEHLVKNWKSNPVNKGIHQVLEADDQALPELELETTEQEGNLQKRRQHEDLSLSA